MPYGSPLFLSTYFPFLFIGGAVLPVICFFMFRNDEKRSGRIQYSGKSLVFFTLMNSAAWIVYLGLTMVLMALIMGGPGDYAPLRIGLVMIISGAASLKILGVLWTSLTKTDSWLPRGNMFVKCYSGFNLFILFIGFVGTVSFILYFLMEMMVGTAEWRLVKEQVKAFIVLTITSGIFLYVNLKIFQDSDDEIVLFGRAVER